MTQLRFALPMLALALAAGVVAPPAAVADDARLVHEIYVVENPEWFDDNGLLTVDLHAEGAPQRLGLRLAADRPMELITSDEQAHRRALADKAEHGTPSERFATDQAGPMRDDDITLDECRERSDLSARPQGWIKNHYSYCKLSYVLAVQLRCKLILCVTVGIFSARITTLGVAYNGLRNVEFMPTIDQIFAFRSANGGSFGFEVECAGSPDSDSCVPDEASVTRRVPQWKLDGEATLSFHSPALPPSSSAGEQRDFGTFQIKVRFLFPAGVMREQTLAETSVRFDSAWYLSPNRGSIFNRTDPWLSYSITDPAVTYSAWNIHNAQRFPEATEPPLGGKRLPGASAADPLHRAYHDRVRRAANRSEATGYCHIRWAGYPDQGQDCDEYPFACTNEGAATYQYDSSVPRNSYAVRPIPRYDNQEAGSRLGRWFSADRILDGDPFHVRIFGADGTPPTPPTGPPADDDSGIDCGDGLT
jgi:Deoxyribonuclease NucA/NucB